MNKIEWKKIFEEKHLPELLDTDWDGEDWDREVTKEGEDYFVLTTDGHWDTTYYFNQEEAEILQDNLPIGWTLTDFVKEIETGKYPWIEVKSESKYARFKIKTIIENTRETNKKELTVIDYSPELEKETLRQLAKAIQSGTSEDVSLARGTIIHLLAKKELKEKLGESAENLMVPITDLGLSMRSFNCLNREGYENVIDIVWEDEKKIEYIAQLGRKGYQEIVEKIESLSLDWNLKKKFSL